MTLRIDSKVVNLTVLAMPAMNFGQSWRYEGRKNVGYQYEVAEKEWRQCITPWWKRLCEELEEDLPYRKRGDFPELDRIEDLQFPDLAVMISDYPNDLEAVTLWDGLSILNAIQSPLDAPEYIIDSLDSVTLRANTLYLKGRAFRVYL